MKEMENTKVKGAEAVKLPCGKFCSNCGDGCIYWEPYNRDYNGRQYCNHYGSYYYPSERQGCLSFRD